MASKQPTDYITILSHIESLGIPIYDFKCVTRGILLGYGAVMNVYESTFLQPGKNTPIKAALKEPRVNLTPTIRDKAISTLLSDIRQELRIMKHLESHPYIAGLYGITFDNLKPILIVELAANSLPNYLCSRSQANSPVNWDTKARFCCEIADGLYALHRVGVVHGDIKGDNILLFPYNDNNEVLVAKISDFGYSATTFSVEGGRGPGGTPSFWAPECNWSAPDDFKAFANLPTRDNYSYGLVAWQIAKNGEVPFGDMVPDEVDDLKHQDKEMNYLMEQLDSEVPENFKILISGMLRYQPSERTSFSSVRAIMNIGAEKRLIEAMTIFNMNANELPQELGKFDVSSAQSSSISPAIKSRILRMCTEKAEKGDADAAYSLSLCYQLGFGIEANKGQMISWAIKAAELGSFDGISNVASQYTAEELRDFTDLLFPWLLKLAQLSRGSPSMELLRSSSIKDKASYEEKPQEPKTAFSDMIATTWSWLTGFDLHNAVREGNLEAVRYYLGQKRAKVNERDRSNKTPLHIATEEGNVEMVKLLLEEFKADTKANNGSGETPLHLAARNGNVKIARTLCEYGADVAAKDMDGNTPTHRAAHWGKYEIVELLIEDFGADVKAKNKYDETALHHAAKSGHIKIVRLLVEKFRADVNSKNTLGNTPSHLTARYGNLETLRVLVKRLGADLSIKNNDGWTPLHYVARNGRTEFARALVGELGADVNATNNEGWTPLYYAAKYGYTEVVRMFATEFGADVNIKNREGWTPLHHAATNGHVEVVALLVNELGADVKAKDRKGRAPRDVACLEAPWTVKHEQEIKNICAF